MEINVLSKKEATSLAKQQSNTQEVKLVAIDYNWGAPVSGRFDSDRMNLWVKVKVSEKGKLFLQGKSNNGTWDINQEMIVVGSYKEIDTAKKFTFYQLSLINQSEFPVEFVLRYDTESGTQYYDNNNGANYKVAPYSNFGSSALCNEKIIFDLEEIKKYKMYKI